jgi:hypothetical protein
MCKCLQQNGPGHLTFVLLCKQRTKPSGFAATITENQEAAATSR